MKLKIDYDFVDNRQSKIKFKSALLRIRRVYESKRTYYPTIKVLAVYKTKKGVHIILDYIDMEFYRGTYRGKKYLSYNAKLYSIILQDVFSSDVTRSMFDLLRISRGDHYFNLLFIYKNKYSTKEIDLKPYQSMVDFVFDKKRLINKPSFTIDSMQ